jgi:hypothetical protein
MPRSRLSCSFFQTGGRRPGEFCVSVMGEAVSALHGLRIKLSRSSRLLKKSVAKRFVS